MDRLKEQFIRIWQIMKRLYAAYGLYMTMAAKTAVAFCALFYINRYFPGRPFMLRTIVVLAISLLASVLPWKYLTFLGAVWLLAQLSAMSLEATAFTLVVLLILALLRYIMLPGSGLALVLLPILFIWRIPFLIPLVVGVTGVLSGFVSVGSGVIVYYLLRLMAENLEYLSSGSDTIVQRMLFLLKGMAEHEQMLTVLVCFCLTALLVHLISRIKVDYAPQIAVGFGALLNPLLLAALFDFQNKAAGPPWLIGGSLIALPLALLISLLYRFLDYTRTENVQFEDDEYYYYVKAIPKMAVSLPPREQSVQDRPAAGVTRPNETKEETADA